MTDTPSCRLCGADAVNLFHADKKREYYQCPVCRLVFVPEKYWLSAEEEKAEYDLHQNIEDDSGYRNFLSRLSAPLLQRLNPEAHGLDFGCGPGPLLAKIFHEHGYSVALYDPFYHNDGTLLDEQYDFITVTEVAEHFKEPGMEFRTLFSMLKPGGWLGVMTKRVLGAQAFGNWHYIRDPTHICFFSEETFDFLARSHNAELYVAAKDVVLFMKY